MGIRLSYEGHATSFHFQRLEVLRFCFLKSFGADGCLAGLADYGSPGAAARGVSQ